MRVEQKANLIYLSMLNANDGVMPECAKKSALIAVNEINDLLGKLEPRVDEDLWLYRELKAKIPYWREVRVALEKL